MIYADDNLLIALLHYIKTTQNLVRKVEWNRNDSYIEHRAFTLTYYKYLN